MVYLYMTRESHPLKPATYTRAIRGLCPFLQHFMGSCAAALPLCYIATFASERFQDRSLLLPHMQCQSYLSSPSFHRRVKWVPASWGKVLGENCLLSYTCGRSDRKRSLRVAFDSCRPLYFLLWGAKNTKRYCPRTSQTNIISLSSVGIWFAC